MAKTPEQSRIDACKNLVQLCATLNAIEAEIENEDSDFNVYIGDYVDITDLPTFGGVAPKNTAGIWSWDAEYQIVAGGDGFEIESRN